MRRVLTACTFLFLFLVALWQLGQAGLLAAKAWAAPILIERAWNNQLITGEQHKPWPWADSAPVARMEFPDHDVTRYVLDGDNMRNLAFGPVIQRTGDTTFLFGHRDTHFAFLDQLETSDRLQFRLRGEEEKLWKIDRFDIVSEKDLYIPDGTPGEALYIITCYPFGQLNPDTDQRYIVSLTPIVEKPKNI